MGAMMTFYEVIIHILNRNGVRKDAVSV